jgi:hypothetical protein
MQVQKPNFLRNSNRKPLFIYSSGVVAVYSFVEGRWERLEFYSPTTTRW